MRDAAVPGRAGALHAVAAQRARLRHVGLHVELGIVFDRLAGLGIEALGPVEVVDVLAALDEAAVVAIERVEEAVAAEMADHLARLAVDGGVVQHVDAVLVVVPRVVRQVLVVPDELAGIDVERRPRSWCRDCRRGAIPDRIAAPDCRCPRWSAWSPDRRSRSATCRRRRSSRRCSCPSRSRCRARRASAPRTSATVRCRSCVERREPAARAAVAGAVGDQHLAFGGDRRGAEALLRCRTRRRPATFLSQTISPLSRLSAIDAAIRQVGDHEIFPQRDAAGAAGRLPSWRTPGSLTQTNSPLLRLARVDLVDRAPAVGGVHEAVVDQRIDLVLGAVLADILHAARAPAPTPCAGLLTLSRLIWVSLE